MLRHNEGFDTNIVTSCIVAEHMIGLIKGRLPWLINIAMKAIDDKKT